MRRSILGAVGVLLLSAATAAQATFEELARDARTGRNYERARAVRALADLDSPEAWEVVFELLDEPAGEAGGSAGWYLGTCRVAAIVERLAGKEGLGARDERTRARAAEALGRSPLEVDIEALFRAASKDRDADVRRFAWRAFGLRAANQDVWGDAKQRAKRTRALVTAAEKEKDVAARGRALVVAATLLGDEARAAVARAVTDKRPGIRAAAAHAAGVLEGAGAWLDALAADEHWSVRRAAFEAWATAPSRATLEKLVERLVAETRPRLRARLVALLREFSGHKHGADARAWRDWLGSLEAGWRPHSGQRSSRPAPLEVSSTWRGVPILSGSVAFLIDLSGSIREQRADGRTRKDVVDEELAEALASLGPEAQFVLVGYHGDVLVWRDEPQAATATNVEKALEWFRKIDSSGPGNLWSAIEATWSLSDAIDTLFVLHDGAPTGDVHYRAELYRDLFLAANLTRSTFFDTILVDSPRYVRGLFSELAERSGGIVAARDLDGAEAR
ncbi:MAG: hypothetical protein WD226_12660 [Planctomycetota bacterium]